MNLYNSKYCLPEYRIYFDEEIADKYKPIVYSHECLSGDPKALYYRIVRKSEEICIQFFFYWSRQWCMMSSHTHDYEPIFIYLKHIGQNNFSIELIVNGGLGGRDCGFHKNEIRPKDGQRSNSEVHFTTRLTQKPYYPFGKDGTLEYRGCEKTYPLSGDDLEFKESHPLFGIRACSNVFSGAKYNIQGDKFDPPLKRLTDDVLTEWYFNHYNDEDDMPFGHDVADPFSYPYIRYRFAGNDLPKPKQEMFVFAKLLQYFTKVFKMLIRYP